MAKRERSIRYYTGTGQEMDDLFGQIANDRPINGTNIYSDIHPQIADSEIEVDPLRETLQAIADIRLHMSFSFNDKDEFEEEGHGYMIFDHGKGVAPVSIWVGSKENHPAYANDGEIPKRTIFISQLGEGQTDQEVKEQFIDSFLKLGQNEQSLVQTSRWIQI